jgi:glycine/D-amino acid oxidase-like deaminating enzyme
MTPELTKEQVAKLGGAARWGVTPSDPMGTTLRRIDTAQGGNRLITRTCATLRPDMVPRKRDLERASKTMQRKFDARFPGLAGLRMEYTWAGALCLSRNGVSVAREIEKGVVAACVQNGLGTARGTLTGMAAAETALGLPSPTAEFFNAQEAPARLPPQPMQQIGANAILRWKEWRAHAE